MEEECEEPELIDVTRVDIVGECKEKAVLLNRAARSVSLVEDRKGAGWVECAGSSDGFIVRYGGLNNRMGVEEEEALNLVEEVEETMRSKLSAVTLALRNLSFVPGNEECMGNDTRFLAMCGEVLAKNAAEAAEPQREENEAVPGQVWSEEDLHQRGWTVEGGDRARGGKS